MALLDGDGLNASHHFEGTAERYESVTRTRPEFAERFGLFKRQIDAAWEQVGGEGAVAVDLGCGSGDLTWYLAGAGFQTVAVDGSPAMLERARRQAHAHGVRGIRFIRRDLPLVRPSDLAPHGAVALIVASSVVEYVEDDQAVLDQCGELLAPRGRALISFPNQRSCYWALQRRLKETRLFRSADSYHQRHQYLPSTVRSSADRARLYLTDVDYFALPLQRKLPSSWRVRPPWLATMFLASLTRVPDGMSAHAGERVLQLPGREPGLVNEIAVPQFKEGQHPDAP